MSKLTEWFPADVKPVRNGSYERNYGFSDPVKNRDYWSDGHWYVCGMGEENTNPEDIITRPYKWRGLAADPAGSAP